jgi:hypothetical protein
MLQSGDYWLEGADQEEILLGSEKVDRDPTEAEEKEADAAFEEKYKEYVDLAGEAVVDQSTDKEIPPSSPVLEAKKALKRPKWTKVENMEWSTRTLGKDLMIVDLQSEHHGDKQTVGELGPEARAMIYFFPAGYVEKAVIHLAYRKGDNEIDTTKEPWTIVTRPYEGVADLIEGSKDVNVHEDGEDDEG